MLIREPPPVFGARAFWWGAETAKHWSLDFMVAAQRVPSYLSLLTCGRAHCRGRETRCAG